MARQEFRLRLCRQTLAEPFEGFDATVLARRREADEFYAELQKDIEFFGMSAWCSAKPLRDLFGASNFIILIFRAGLPEIRVKSRRLPRAWKAAMVDWRNLK